jgi:hypothetical protein
VIELTPTDYWLTVSYWWVCGALVGIGIGRWIQKKLEKKS